MADKEHLARLKREVKAWNEWRDAALHDIEPNLSGADLHGAELYNANLCKANLCMADLSVADLRWAKLWWADLSGADLRGAELRNADLRMANLGGADLSGADLSGAHLVKVYLAGANLGGADLSHTLLVETNFAGANLTGCKVYGTSAWNVNLKGAHQSDLVITPSDEPAITVDNLEVAQFIYLLLHNDKIRRVIDTITSKAVLILGRFTPERKAVLDAIREELRRRNYLPILFDFEAPSSRDFTETVSTLAHMARFIVADLTEAKSIPQELQRIVPDLPSVPVQPVLQASAQEYSMFEHFKRYPWVLATYQYQNLEEVIASLAEKVIAPAELKANELLGQVRR
jgi:Pentapeptide repeats (8 copies)